MQNIKDCDKHCTRANGHSKRSNEDREEELGTREGDPSMSSGFQHRQEALKGHILRQPSPLTGGIMEASPSNARYPPEMPVSTETLELCDRAIDKTFDGLPGAMAMSVEYIFQSISEEWSLS